MGRRARAGRYTNGVRLLVSAFFVVALAHCAGRPSKGPNIVLITIDTLRADHCSLYGYEWMTTPWLERLADQGTRFETAYAPMPTTAPSHASLFTSRYPLSHQVLKNGHLLAENHELLAEVLERENYRTGAFVSAFVLDDRFGFGQGFQTYDDDFSVADSSYKMRVWEGIELPGGFDRRAHETSDRAIAWIRAAAVAEPFFLWVHYYDPHHPYAPPRALAERFVARDAGRGDPRRAIGLYDAEVAFTDGEMGRLLDALDDVSAPDNTLVVVTADHGEGLLDHGFLGHGPILYEETMRVPLVMRWQGRIPAGAVLGGPVDHVDLMPTILGLAGIPAGEAVLQGRDLSDVIAGDNRLDPLYPVFFQRRHFEARRVPSFRIGGVALGDTLDVAGAKFGVRRGAWKYIEAEEEGTRELFDLEADPGELTNLEPSHPEVAAELAERLLDWRKEQTQLVLGPPTTAGEEELEKLRALGYVQ